LAGRFKQCRRRRLSAPFLRSSEECFLSGRATVRWRRWSCLQPVAHSLQPWRQSGRPISTGVIPVRRVVGVCACVLFPAPVQGPRNARVAIRALRPQRTPIEPGDGAGLDDDSALGCRQPRYLRFVTLRSEALRPRLSTGLPFERWRVNSNRAERAMSSIADSCYVHGAHEFVCGWRQALRAKIVKRA